MGDCFLSNYVAFSERNAHQHYFNLFDFVPIKKQSAGILKHISEQSSVAAKAQITGTRNSRTVLPLKISANQYWNRTIHKKCRLKYGKDLCDMYSETEFLSSSLFFPIPIRANIINHSAKDFAIRLIAS